MKIDNKHIKIQSEIFNSMTNEDGPCCLGLLTNKSAYGEHILETSLVNIVESYARAKETVVYFDQVLDSERIEGKLRHIYEIGNISKYYFNNFRRFYNTTDPFIELFGCVEGHDPAIVFINQLAHFYICENDIYDSFEFKYFLRTLRSSRFSELKNYEIGNLPFKIVFTASYENAEQGCDLNDDATFSFLAEPYDPLNVIMLDEVSSDNTESMKKEISYFTREIDYS